MSKEKSIFLPFKETNLQMLMVMLLIGMANILLAEKLTINGGLGWDGAFYGAWTKDFYNSFFVHGLPQYYVSRVLPIAIVHYGMRIVLFPFFGAQGTSLILSDNRNIILAFDVYNLILLLISTYVWGLIADELKISLRGKWFGFCFLFLNYAILKNNFYAPVLTDTTAFTLGILTFYFFLTNKPLGLLAVIVLGAFTWPIVPFMAALLYVFPYNKESRSEAKSTTDPPPFKLNILCAALVTGFILLIILYLFLRHSPETISFGRILRIHLSLLYPSILALLLYIFFSLKVAFSDKWLFDLRHVLISIKWKRVFVAGLIFVLLGMLTRRMASGEEIAWSGSGGYKGFLTYTVLSALTEPFIYLVAHVVYYGPVIILLVFFWKPFCDSIQEYGIGLRILVILNVFLSINPQSRFQINVITIFVILLVKLLDRSILKGQSLVFWILLSLFFSKVWYVFNTAPQIDDETLEVLLRFPLQHYFMNSGPWMSSQMYYVQGGVILLTAIILYFLVARKPPQFEVQRASESAA